MKAPYVFLLAILSAVSGNQYHSKQLDEVTQSLSGMELEALATTARKYPQLQNKILEEFILGKYRLNEHRIDIDLQWQHPNIVRGTQYIGYGLSDTLSVLELFGHVFTRLEIHIDLPGCKEETIEQIVRHVAKYCSNAYQKVVFRVRHAAANVEFLLPDVTEVEFMYDPTLTKPNKNPIELCEIFPRMQQLLLFSVRHVPLNRHFPYLTQFQMYEQVENDNDLKKFFKLNPQLRSVRAPILSNLTYLAEVNKMLPHLQSLGIDYTEALDIPTLSAIDFQNVKEFTLNLEKLLGDIPKDLANSLSLLEFDQLASFKLISYPKSAQSKQIIIDLIAKHKQLSKVEFEKFDLSNAELMELVKKSPQLKTLTVSCINYDTIKEIEQFLKEDTNLSTIVIGDDSSNPTKFFKIIESNENWRLTKKEMRNAAIYLTCERV